MVTSFFIMSSNLNNNISSNNNQQIQFQVPSHVHEVSFQFQSQKELIDELYRQNQILEGQFIMKINIIHY